jgi:hypothetical protein
VHRERDAAPEAIAHVAVAVREREAGLDQQLGRERTRQPAQQEVRVAGRVPDAELGRDVPVDPAGVEVPARLLALPALDQRLVI